MSELVPPEDIERIVGVTRQAVHVGRAVSAEQKVYVLHSHHCRHRHDTGKRDLRDCPFAQALDRGIDERDWAFEDMPVQLAVTADGNLVPLRTVTDLREDA